MAGKAEGPQEPRDPALAVPLAMKAKHTMVAMAGGSQHAMVGMAFTTQNW